MADETKKYLIDIESNLKEYADQAAEAKKKVDELKAANDALMQSGKASAAEIEASKAALKNANDEYRKAQSLLKTAIANNQSETGSRKQLSEQLKLQEQALGKLGNAYVKDAQGVMRLNPLYTEQRNQIAATKQKILDYDKALNDGRSNIGRYGESVKAAFTEGAKHILSMVSPMALVAAGIALAKKVFDGLKDAIMSTTGAINALNVVQAFTKQMFYDIAINGRLSAKAMYEVGQAAIELNKLRTDEYKDQFLLSKINREQQEIREQSIDRTRTHEQRLESLNKVRELESQKTKIQVGHLQEELKANIRIMEQRPKDEKQRQKVWELMTKINDAYAAEDQAMRHVETQRTGFIQEQIDQRKKQFDAYLDEIEKTNEANDKAALKKKEDKKKQELDADKEAQDFVDREIARMDKEAEDKWNAEVEFQRKLYDHNREVGQAEYDARIAEEKALAEAVIQIHEALNDSKINLAISATNFLNAIAGENKALQNAALIAEKSFAIAQVIIQTTKANATIRALAAASVLPGPGYLIRLGASMAAAMVPINLNRAAAVIDIAAIIAATVAGIAGNAKSGISTSGSISAPTSITSSPAVEKSFAAPVGSTILTQPQLSQTQLNALPSQGLTAQDIANAVSRLPAPKVSVEDINARMDEVNKVKVRADI